MQTTIFRQYDIRGVWNVEWCVSDVSLIAGGIINFLSQNLTQQKQIFIGQDRRESSAQIAGELSATFSRFGWQVQDVGVCPTPLVASWIKRTPNSAGLMVTASHNPNNYNGIKIYQHALGGQVWGENIACIAELCQQNLNFCASVVPGKVQQNSEPKDWYLQLLGDEFSDLARSPIKVGFDCLGGSGLAYLREIIAKLNLKNVFIVDEQARKIKQPDPAKPENLQALTQLVQENNLDVGIAFDGDADRMATITADGKVVSGDQLIALFCQQLLVKVLGSSVVVDVKTSDIVSQVAAQHGGTLHWSATGNPYLQAIAKEKGAIFCGEASCHFTFFDRGPKVDDGLYAALRLLELLAKNTCPLADLVKRLPRTVFSPEIILNYSDVGIANLCLEQVRRKMDFFGARLIDLDGVKAHFAYGWGLIRKSNTQPVLSLRFEATDLYSLLKIKRQFADSLAGLIDNKDLEKIFE